MPTENNYGAFAIGNQGKQMPLTVEEVIKWTITFAVIRSMNKVSIIIADEEDSITTSRLHGLLIWYSVNKCPVFSLLLSMNHQRKIMFPIHTFRKWKCPTVYSYLLLTKIQYPWNKRGYFRSIKTQISVFWRTEKISSIASRKRILARK